MYNRQALCDIITTAIEGGSNYWAMPVKADRTEEGDPKRVELLDREDDFAPYTVTINDVQAAVRKVQAGDVRVNSTIAEWITSGDAGMIDATAADVLMQVACFDEIRYG